MSEKVILLGLGSFWIYAGVSKLWNGFDAAPFLKTAIQMSRSEPPKVFPWAAGLASSIALPLIRSINVAIPSLETVLGIGFIAALLDNRFREPSLATAAAFSVVFLIFGANGWNPVLLAAVLIVLFLCRQSSTGQPTSHSSLNTSGQT